MVEMVVQKSDENGLVLTAVFISRSLPFLVSAEPCLSPSMLEESQAALSLISEQGFE